MNGTSSFLSGSINILSLDFQLVLNSLDVVLVRSQILLDPLVGLGSEFKFCFLKILLCFLKIFPGFLWLSNSEFKLSLGLYGFNKILSLLLDILLFSVFLFLPGSWVF